MSNLHSGAGNARNAQERTFAYLKWTNSAVRMLGTQISQSDLNYLVLTDRYKLLLTAAGTLTGSDTSTQAVLNGLVDRELDAQVTAFDEAVKALERQIARWSGHEQFVMPDTSFYIRHQGKLEESDIPLVFGDPHSDFVLLVPMVIVDELDRLKDNKDKHIRWRAGYTLAVLDRLFPQRGVSRAQLRPRVTKTEQGSLIAPLGEVSVELLFDPPGHVRLPDEDDEIIDQALSVEPLAARPLTLLTYDTGQSMRARNAGLRAVKLSKALEDEPT